MGKRVKIREVEGKVGKEEKGTVSRTRERRGQGGVAGEREKDKEYVKNRSKRRPVNEREKNEMETGRKG